MKIAKFLISAFLIFAGLLYIGESRQLNAVRSIERTFARIHLLNDMVVDSNGSIAQLADDIKERFDCEMIFTEYNSPSELEKNMTIYCRLDARPEVEGLLSLGNNEFNSFLSGKLTIEFRDIPQTPTIGNGVSIFYLHGGPESITALHKHLSRESDVVFEWASFDNYYDKIAYIVLFVIIIMIAILSLLDSEFQKKEIVIRTFLGTGKYSFFIKNIAVDSLIFLGIITAEILFIMQINNILDMFNLIIGFYFILIAINSIAYLGLLRLNFGRVLKGQRYYSRILHANYILKLAVSFSTIFLVSLFYGAINNYNQILNANKYYLEMADYSYAYFQNPLIDNDIHSWREEYRAINETIYREYYDIIEPIMLRELTMDSEGINVLYANSNAVTHLKSAIPEWDGEINSDVIIFFPPGEKSNTQGINELKIDIALELFEDLEGGGFEYSYDVIYLEKDYQVFSINSSKFNMFDFLYNPTIILYTVAGNEMPGDISDSNQYSPKFNNTLYKIDDDILNEIKERFPLEKVTITNSLELFKHHSYINKIELMFLGSFSILMSLLLIIILSTVVKLEFLLNGTELCIRKILGYNMFERYSEFFMFAAVSSAVGTGVCALIANRYNLASLSIVLIVGLIVMLTEFLLILGCLKKAEKENINKVLKGGVL